MNPVVVGDAPPLTMGAVMIDSLIYDSVKMYPKSQAESLGSCLQINSYSFQKVVEKDGSSRVICLFPVADCKEDCVQ